jgi:short-subunit dehydrogenase
MTRALVTGASGGIGEAFARQLAASGHALVLVARRKDKLEALAAELREKHQVEVHVEAVDLSQESGAARLFDHTERAGKPVDVLINNAGFGTFAEFTEIPWESTREQLRLNVFALTELTWRFARSMRARKSGRILNIASIGGHTPAPYFAVYGAAKAYVRSFSEALSVELRGTGVTVTSASPGLVLTGFQQVSGQQVSSMIRWTALTPERCAQLALRATFKGRRSVVTGWVNRLTAWALDFSPRWLTLRSVLLTTGTPQRRDVRS